MPKATPSSYAVSETAEAAPALFFGTAETMASVVKVMASPTPSPTGMSANPNHR